jgi:hypothetical protein
MNKYQVTAERVVLEVMEVEAESEEKAFEKAAEADNSEWTTWGDVSWEIKGAFLVK